MGSSAKDAYDQGFLFMALDPAMFRSPDDGFRAEVLRLAEEIRNSPAIDEAEPVRLPGDRARKAQELARQSGVLDLDDRVWDLLCHMARNPWLG